MDRISICKSVVMIMWFCEVIMVIKNGINWLEVNDFCLGLRLICFYYWSFLGVFIVFLLCKVVCVWREIFINIRYDLIGYIDRVYWIKYK